MPQWLAIFQAALATLTTAFGTLSAANVFHGGAANTMTKVGSALAVVNAVSTGTAAALTNADVHPALAAHADAIAATHEEVAAAIAS